MGQVIRGVCVTGLAGVALLACTGCGSDLVQASGRVQYTDGSPVTGAVRIIRFEPDDETTAEVRQVASGEIAEDGSFTLMRKRPGDGVYKGNYVVTFTVLKSPRTGESLIQEKYNMFGLSPFEVKVDGNKSDYLFELEKLGK